MSLALEKLAALESLSESLEEVGSNEATSSPIISPHRFMDHVRTVTTAFIIAGRLEGARLIRVVEDYGFSETMWARVIVWFDGVVFYIYAKPYIDVPDVDLLVDDAAEIAEKLGENHVVPVGAAYEYSFDAERYAKSIEVELVHLGL
ncbi:hypothetical protein PYJP_10790 [Pyrofollis japonicus]|uniref:hypothetical protein n=1 Tax=Pyrofollis japonicus TaxID=3060460 RepID=UPI00295A8FB8|nr:hypothetical protein [Pyrofollis japonicus]BEP17727.1 hypothetical protein PYJP_10790 [Pyrofollis japonicus]